MSSWKTAFLTTMISSMVGRGEAGNISLYSWIEFYVSVPLFSRGFYVIEVMKCNLCLYTHLARAFRFLLTF